MNLKHFFALLALFGPLFVSANQADRKQSELDALKQRLQSLQQDFRDPQAHQQEAADELRHWLKVHDDIAWTPLTTEQTTVGDLVWSTGQSSTVMPIYAAIQGPLPDGQVLYWWGQAPAERWTQMLTVFQQIARSTAARP